MCQQKHSSLYTWTTLLEAVPRWAVGLLETLPCHPLHPEEHPMESSQLVLQPGALPSRGAA